MASPDAIHTAPSLASISRFIRGFGRPEQAKIDVIPEEVISKKSSTKDFAQRKEEAGIFVTDELDKAVERCRHKVERIAKECRRRNRRFRDIEFDLEGDRDRCLWGLSGPGPDDSPPRGVRRATSMFTNPSFFANPGQPGRHAIQGRLGNCWFLSAIATVGTVPRLIEQICVSRDEKVGVYGFIFYMDGGWVDVVIDDFLFTKAPRYEELADDERALYQYSQSAYESMGRQGSKALHFSASEEENETWVPLIEKAYAKVYGDYTALDGGRSTDALEDLTGGVSSYISVVDILDPEAFWTEELIRVGEDRLFGCFIQGMNPIEQSEQYILVNGLICYHEYSVIAAIEVAGKKFIKLRNPWGKTEWSGPWSDGSKEWTTEWLHRLPELKHSFANDGEFLMEYDDFLKTWTGIGVTHLFDSSWLLSSQWLNVTARAFPCAWNFGDVTFTIAVTEATPAIVVLGKLNSRAWEDLEGPHIWSFDFAIYPRGASEPLCTATPGQLWLRTLSIEVDLEPGEYVVQVRLDRAVAKTDEAMMEAAKSWNLRKLSRKAASMAICESIAINFVADEPGRMLPLPASYFAGKDLAEIEVSANAMPAPLVPTSLSITVSDEPASTSAEDSIPDSAPSAGTQLEDKVEPSDTNLSDGKEAHPPKDGETAKPDKVSEEGSSGEGTKTPTGTEANGGKPIRIDFKCEKCENTPIVGVRYHCVDSTCRNTDLCQKCVDANAHPKDHALLRLNCDVDSDVSSLHAAPPSPTSSIADHHGPEDPVHKGFSCNICKKQPIFGPRYHCLDSDCPDFDMCQTCMNGGSHATSHQVLRINDPADDHSKDDEGDKNKDAITLGLRVYTKKHAPATVRGQLRHGKVLKWKRAIDDGGLKA